MYIIYFLIYSCAMEPESNVPQAPPKKDDITENKDLAAFSYLWVMSVFVYLARKKSPFVRFHARQSMVLFALSIPIWLIPYVGRFLELGVLALAVLGFMAAAQGEWKRLPLVGRFAGKDQEKCEPHQPNPPNPPNQPNQPNTPQA